MARMIMEQVDNRSFTLTLVTANEAGYDASKIPSRRDPS